jgi:hypothetical protein
MHHRSHRFHFACALTLGLLATSSAWAVNGPGSLFVSGASHTPTHWNIPIGVATNAEIRGVGSEVGSPLPATIVVIIKSSAFGNTFLTGFQIGTSNNYSFTYTPPAIANGDDFDACNTTVVAYVENGRNSDNDLIDDGVQNNSSGAAAGFRFVDAAGRPIDCVFLGAESSPWSGVKGRYR